MKDIARKRPTTVLDKGYQRAVGCLVYPLPLVLVWKKTKFRSIYNPTKKDLYVEWYDHGEFIISRTVKPFTISGRGRCTEIREYLT